MVRTDKTSDSPDATATGTDTPGIDPDTYSCSQPGYIDFENLPDGTDLSANSIDGVQFTTTNGYTWLVGDFATGNYNGKYPAGDYTSQGTHWAWLGPDEGAGRIDFVGGPVSYFSLLTSANTTVELDAYDSSNDEIAVAGPIVPNSDTGTMDQLAVTSTSANIAYVIVHDDGNYFVVDSMCTDALDVTAPPNTGVLEGGGSPDVLPTSCSHGSPVNCVTGEFWHAFTDLTIPGKGLPIDLTRTYSSLAASDLGPLGYGWTDSYNMSLSFDAAGDATIEEENGASITASYTGSGYQFPTYVPDTFVQNSDGTYTLARKDGSQYVFSSSGQLTTEVDRNGNATMLSYNASNQLSSVTDPDGRSLIFTYGANGLLSSVVDPTGRSVSFSYDSSDNLISATDADGGTWSFTYDPNHLMLTMTDPRGGATTNSYDSSGRVLSQTDPMGRQTTYSYSAQPGYNGETTMTDPLGNVTEYQYVTNELVSTTKAAGTPQAATWSYSYDPITHGITSTTDPNGNTVTNTYDASGNVLTATDAMGRVTSFTYNSFGEPLTETDPLGNITSYTYDADGNLTNVSRPDGSQIVYTYGISSDPGQLTSSTDPNGGVTKFGYDSAGDQTSITDPDGDTSTATYDAIGQKLTTINPNGNVPGGDPSDYTTKYTYDAESNLLTTTDPLGHVTTNAVRRGRQLGQHD